VTNVNAKALSIFPPQITHWIELNFLHGRVNKDKKFVLEKTYKQKMLSHIFGIYFALASAGNYNLPLGTLTSELQMGDNVLKPLLQNIGCA
jgi:hypothetical protein